MQSMSRRLFYAAAYVSALLWLATLFLWPLSYLEYLDVSYTRLSGTKYTVIV